MTVSRNAVGLDAGLFRSICYFDFVGRGSYTKFSDKDRADIGKYAKLNGTTSTQRKFKGKFPNLKESTVRSLRAAYDRRCSAMKTNHGADFNPDQHVVSSMPKQSACNKGRPLKMGALDATIIEECKKIREAGGVLNSLVLTAVTKAVIRVKAPEKQHDH